MTTISFDVFDTVIIRKTYLPCGIFELAEEIVGGNFKELRIKAEEDARREKAVYNLDDIYRFLPQFDKQLEIDLELENCLPNPSIAKTYYMHEFAGDNIIFISDMYLSSKIIVEMLEKCGYKNPKVFVSCENDSHKGNGGLFKTVQKLVGKITKHYGDNYIADILGARMCNIPAEYVPNLASIKTAVPNISNTKLKKILVLSEQTSQLCLDEKVARYFTPMIYNFVKWILNERDTNNKDSKIFFNARDGYLPYLIARDIFKAENIEYIRASRKSVLYSSLNFDVPLTHKSNRIPFERMLIQRTESIAGFLKSINCDEQNLVQYKNMKAFLLVNEAKLYNHFKKNRDNARKYFENCGISNGDMFVDIGYFGTIQYSVEKIMDIKLKGYYLQTFSACDSGLERYSYFSREIIKYCLLIESLFSSSEDGINGYDDDGQPIYYQDNKQKKCFSELISKTILNFAQYLHDNCSNIALSDIEMLAIRFLYYPTIEESNYCNAPIFENGDVDKFESVVWYDRERIKSGELQDCYNKSYWRPAFLKQLQNDRELAYLEKFLKVE